MRIIVSLLLLASLAGCADREGQKLAKQTEKLVTQDSKPVSVIAVAHKDLTETVDITGDVVTSQEASMSSKIGGKLTGVYVRNGDSVSVGQVIARIDSANQSLAVEQARSQATSARASLNQALTNARVGPVRSAAAVNSAKAQLRSAQSQFQKAINGARPEEKRQADSAVASAKSNLDTATKQRDRIAKLFAEGAASQQQYEQAQNAFAAAENTYNQAVQQQEIIKNWTRPEDIESARAQVLQAEEGVRQAQASQRLDSLLLDQVSAARANLQSAMTQLSLAMNNLGDTQIRAPFAGQVNGDPLQVGSVVSPGMPIANLVGKGGGYFEGAVPANSLSMVKTGSPVKVTIDGQETGTLIGTVSTIAPSASTVGRVFKVRIDLASFGSGLRPGMFARGQVSIREIPNAMVVPNSAITTRNDKPVVFVVEGDKVRMQAVVLGLVDGNLTQVKGLAGNETVVTRGQGDLEEGTKVRVEKPSASLRQPWA